MLSLESKTLLNAFGGSPPPLQWDKQYRPVPHPTADNGTSHSTQGLSLLGTQNPERPPVLPGCAPPTPKSCRYLTHGIQSILQCSLGVLLPPVIYNREKQGREMWNLEVFAHLRRQMLLHSALQGKSGPPSPWLLQLRPSYHILGVVLLSS